MACLKQAQSVQSPDSLPIHSPIQMTFQLSAKYFWLLLASSAICFLLCLESLFTHFYFSQFFSYFPVCCTTAHYCLWVCYGTSKRDVINVSHRGSLGNQNNWALTLSPGLIYAKMIGHSLGPLNQPQLADCQAWFCAFSLSTCCIFLLPLASLLCLPRQTVLFQIHRDKCTFYLLIIVAGGREAILCATSTMWNTAGV